MKSFGLDASKSGRSQYARDYGIEGEEFSHDWGYKMLRHVLNTYGHPKLLKSSSR